MPASWFSYDDVAERYASAAEPYFIKPAEDLISFLRPAPGTRMLDVGAGSGAVAAAVIRLARRTTVVACDLSVPMLVVARKQIHRLSCVGAELTRLPFARASYDAATLAFVLSHLADPCAALQEIKSVLTVTGRIAVSSWGSSAATSAAGQLWRRTSEQYVEPRELEQAIARVVPSESRLATVEGMQSALAEADFTTVVVHKRDYALKVPTHQFIQSRLLAAPSRYMHARLTPGEWNDFVNTISRSLTDQFGPEVHLHISVNFGIASSAG